MTVGYSYMIKRLHFVKKSLTMKTKKRLTIAMLLTTGISLFGCGNTTSIEKITNNSSQKSEIQTFELTESDSGLLDVTTSIEITDIEDNTTIEYEPTTEDESIFDEDTSEIEDVTAEDETTIENEIIIEETTSEEQITKEPASPVETTPKETKPIETKPIETKPIETKPVETKPIETKPVETKPAAILTGIKATINGKFYIGDTLTAANFNVVGNYSDGHTENLINWGATPLKLTATSNTITVIYQNYSTVVTVNASQRPVPQTQPAVEQKEDYKESKSQNRQMIDNSLLSIGHTERMKRVLDKAARGEDITVAFIGGSITYGHRVKKEQCFATLFTQWLSQQYKVKVNCVNAGINGTPSILGNLRADRDVLCHDPDLVVVEFAVNDVGDDCCKNSYESLIFRLLEYKTEPAVVLLFTITRNGYTCQPWMSQIGQHYNLPMVSVPDSVWKEIEAGRLTYDDYSNDKTHPNEKGHIWIADFLKNCIQKINDAKSETEPYTIPKKPFYKRYYKELTMYNALTLEAADAGNWIHGFEGLDKFQDGWSYEPGANDKPLTFTDADCRMIFVIYRMVPDSNKEFGAVDVKIDGKYVKTIYAVSKDGINNPATCICLETGEKATHTITFEAKKGYEDKRFEILAIGLG